MTTGEIIQKFEVYVDDGTELSSQEELDLANKIYQTVCSFRPWEFLKVAYTGEIINNAVTLPANFSYLCSNAQSTDSSVAQDYETTPIVIYVGSNLKPVRIINFSDRRKYKNQDVAYVDLANNQIVFVQTQTESDCEFDYIKVPIALQLTTSPIFPERFHDIIYHGMAVDDYIIQTFDKAKAYTGENQGKYDSILRDMGFWNAQFTNN